MEGGDRQFESHSCPYKANVLAPAGTFYCVKQCLIEVENGCALVGYRGEFEAQQTICRYVGKGGVYDQQRASLLYLVVLGAAYDPPDN